MRRRLTIAVLGGTGQLGYALALRWARAGHSVIIGSREAAKAGTAAAQIRQALANADVRGAGNKDAAAAAELAVLTVPYAAQRGTVEQLHEALTGKILVDTTVPLIPPKVARVQLPPEGSAVAAIQKFLGESVRVVSAFQNVSARHLKDLGHDLDCDVLICGDNSGARDLVAGLAADIGLRAVHAGPIINSAATEALTSLLISINLRYKIAGAGIRITGLAHTITP
jgi:NADPH-dependent F420 reductase